MATFTWQNRIVGFEEFPVSDLLENPLNFRVHPQSQKDDLRDLIERLGFADPLKVQQGSNMLLDGHLRLEIAKENGEETILCAFLDLNDEESREFLASYDEITAQASTEVEKARALLARIPDKSASARSLLSAINRSSIELPTKSGVLPPGDRSPFEQLTITLAESQATVVRLAIDKAKKSGAFPDSGNRNANGNAIARICGEYLNRN